MNLMLTIGNWATIIGILIFGIIIAAGIWWFEHPTGAIITIIAIIVLCIALIFVFNWYNQNTASGARYYKDCQSNLHNGINRQLKIIADDGMVIYSREGKFDVEIHPEYIVFDENHERTIVYKSYTSTLVIEEIG